MRKKLLIICAGFGQLPAIYKAMELNMEVIVVDKNPDAIGMALADYAYPIDVVDKKEILKIAKNHLIDGAITMQSDLPVPTVGYINDHLGLKGISEVAAITCSNKVQTRFLLEKRGCSQPKFAVVNSIDSAISAVRQVGLPCVIKAPDSSGSRGVVKVSDINEVPDAFAEAFSFTRGEEILVEEYISGLEFGAQTFSENGKCRLVLLHNDTMSSPPYMIPVGHSFPFIHLSENELNDVHSDIRRAVEAVGITDGPANVDLIFEQSSRKIRVIEIGARVGATCLPELVKYHTGIDWVEQTIKNAINSDIDLDVKKKQPVAALILEADRDGEFLGYEVPNDSRIIEFEVTAKSGDKVSLLRKGTDRIGKIIVFGDTAQTAEQIAKELKEKIVIRIR